MARMQRLVRIRKQGAPVTGTGADAVVVRAQGLLNKGDVQGAMQELQTLQGAEAQAAAPWLQQANATATADVSSASAVQNVLQQLMAGAPQVSEAGMEAAGIDVSSITNALAPALGGGGSLEGLKAMLPDFLQQFFGSSATYLSPSMQNGSGDTFPLAPSSP